MGGCQGRTGGLDGAGMGPSHLEAGAPSTKHTSRKEALPALPRLQPSPSSSSTILLGPPACPLQYPLTPPFWNLFPLLRHLQPLNFPNLSIHPSTRPFFESEKQSVKMGYTKTDELAINTIRVLAVSQLSSQACLPQHAATASCPAPPSPLPPPPLTAASPWKPAAPTPQLGQLCSQLLPIGRCDRPCQLWPPWCAHVRCHSVPFASHRLALHPNVEDRGVMRAIKNNGCEPR